MFTNKMASLMAAIVVVAAASGSVAAQSVPCSAVAAAILKNGVTPYHAYMSRTAGFLKGKTEQSEMISSGGALYVQVHGKWRRSPVNAQEMREMQREAADSVSKMYKCTHVGSDVVNGATAQHYHIEGKTEDAEQKEELWLNAAGLIQRMEIDMDVGGGAVGKSHSSIRYDYSSVQVPPGVQ